MKRTLTRQTIGILVSAVVALFLTATCDMVHVENPWASNGSDRISVEGVSLNQEYLEVAEGYSARLNASVYPEDAEDIRLAWISSDEGVATVSGGVVTGVNQGTAVITATPRDGTGSASCTVNVVPPVLLAALHLNKTSTVILLGNTETLIPDYTPDDATNKAVIWSSDNTAVATVDSNGTVTGIGNGTATITVTSVEKPGLTAQCTVTVTSTVVAVTGFDIDQGSMTIHDGGESDLTYNITPSSATNQNVNWISNDTDVATVSNGVVTAVSAGTAVITGSTVDGGKADSCIVTVLARVVFNSNGGSDVTMRYVEVGELITEPSDVTKSGYTLMGWYRDAELTDEWDFATNTVTGSMVLYARWGHCVIFNANGGTGSMANQLIAEGDSANLNVCGFSRVNYAFQGWALTQTGSVVYDNEDSFTMGAADVNLYAIWTHPNLVDISHRGIVSMIDEVDQDLVTYNGKQYLPAHNGGNYTQATSTSAGFVHHITPFEIGQYEVTYELWYTVRTWAAANGYTFASLGREGHDGTAGAEPTADAKLEPVTTINWRDAIVWCNAYSEMEGLMPCYYTDSTLGTVLRTSSNNTNISAANGDIASDCVAWSANGYRLPTEGEWQYAASCAATYPFDYASGADAAYGATTGGMDIDGDVDVQYSGDVAWYSSNSGSKTQPAGTKSGNRYGLHDMSGNVWEWCWDWQGDNPTDVQENYPGTASGSNRVFRGGSWDSSANYLQIGYRFSINPYREYFNLGFRVVRRPDSP